ncbi:helix-turn-helix domain-containing protein [Planosporangium sp. 12N6]|uniref:helix-turn-helix domain-containing protein n=1 Tax=Planosporangium spinosum TaxID=3402278 RepID=UPI003CEEDBCC
MGQSPRVLNPHVSARHRFGAELRRWRERRGLSQAQLGDRLHVSADLIGKVEKAMRWPSSEFAQACDAVLDSGGALAALMPAVEEQRHRQRGFMTLATSDGASANTLPSGYEVLEQATASATAVDPHAPEISSLQRRLLAAYRARLHEDASRPVLLLIGGYAGSGKTELGELLTRMTGWPLLDKDRLTRPLVENLLLAHDADPNDRHSATYLREVRPAEYRCLMAAAFAQLDAGTSAILTAPFLQELPDLAWLRRITARCATTGVDAVTIWVDTDVESMYAYLAKRDAARDSWKLSNWDAYSRWIDPSLRPAVPHFVVDNGRQAPVSLTAQASRLSQIVSPS